MKDNKTKEPPFRRLRGYAFDPSLSMQLDTASINNLTYEVDWEKLEKGPIGEYVEVVDYDPTTEMIYSPVDLDDNYILAMDGLDPSESNPHFHQQMVYAVTMTTIWNFEKALGRKALWSPRKVKKDSGGYYTKYVKTLRIYPHALREANAFYSPQKKSLLFGYFSASPQDVTLHMPGGVVFTCLSHDIIAHETTHALLDGMHSSFTTPSNPDVLAFHEAFSDIVALFQHFTFPEVLKHQIAKTRGNLKSQNLLGELAQEFGKAIGQYGSLRDAIGEFDKETKEWHLKEPNPIDYYKSFEPHARGSILVAAVFEAFLNIYKNRIADLLRIATGGTGVLPEGELHPDLVNRLAHEASRSADHVLKICIRALDYCPTTDITFGDYLRAIITADYTLFKDDSRDYRLVFIDAFRKRGIYPRGIKSLSVESLLYNVVNLENLDGRISILVEFLRDFRNEIYYVKDRKRIFEITKLFIAGGYNKDYCDHKIFGLHERILMKFERSLDFEKLTGLVFSDNWEKLGIHSSNAHGSYGPSFQVHSLRVAGFTDTKGKPVNHIILTLIQRCGVICSKNEKGYKITTYLPDDNENPPENGFVFKGSCTLIFDLDTLNLKFAIRKPILDLKKLYSENLEELDEERIIRQYKLLFENEVLDYNNLYFGDSGSGFQSEPFAMLHRSIN
jgi:hypothetical protein